MPSTTSGRSPARTWSKSFWTLTGTRSISPARGSLTRGTEGRKGRHWSRHAGIYGYRVGFLKRYAALAPSPLEKTEALEQLRVLWHGHRIAVAVSEAEIPPGVDTPQDLEAVRRMLS